MISQFKLNLYPGSKESVSILSKLVESDPEIYRTGIKTLIDIKWQYFSKILQIQAIIYYLYLFIIGTMVLSSYDKTLVVIVHVLTTI